LPYLLDSAILVRMKRLQLFEFEDYAGFPAVWRNSMTRYLVLLHRLVGTRALLVERLAPVLRALPRPRIIDLGSGSGGPMPEVAEALRRHEGLSELTLTLSDAHPNRAAVAEIRRVGSPHLEYLESPLDAAAVDPELEGLRTMICSLHHFRPESARRVLESAARARQPFFAYELSDNGFPRALWWLALPINVLSVLLLTPFVRPLSGLQLLFTYLLPVLPFAIAWDGAVSNARTYTLGDLRELLSAVPSDGYRWEMGTLGGRGGNKLYLLGTPT
jgi:hypothetical protein